MKSEFSKSVLNVVLILIAFILIIFGISSGEVMTVFNKAINICMECIGIG